MSCCIFSQFIAAKHIFLSCLNHDDDSDILLSNILEKQAKQTMIQITKNEKPNPKIKCMYLP